MQNAGLDKAQVEIKIARRDINNLRYADDTTLMAERLVFPKEPQKKFMLGDICSFEQQKGMGQLWGSQKTS